MAVVKKAAAATKTPVKKVVAKTPAKKTVGKGESMACGVCGLSVVVEHVGDIAIRKDSVLLCCGKPMARKASAAKAVVKKAAAKAIVKKAAKAKVAAKK